MRTTVEFEDDTAKALAEVRRETGMGVSAAVNHLIRRGLMVETEDAPFAQHTRSLGLRIDVSNVADALDLLEGAQAR